MNKRACVLAAIVLVMQAFSVHDALARGGRGGGGRGGGGRAMSRPSTPMQRPSTPVQRPSNPGGGFNFNNDIGRPPTAGQLPSGPGNPGGGIGSRPPGSGGGIGNRPPGSVRPPVPPVVAPLPPWGWNGGVIWYPAYGYWGGGFWGPWGPGYYGPYYGEYTHTVTHEVVKSYEVAPDSPGAKVLTNYGLTQTQCTNDATLVIIYGPENSVICAQPNATVAAGQYELNTDDLTIAPLAQS